MYCQNCGSHNPDGAIFCNRCGAQMGAQPSGGQYNTYHQDNSFSSELNEIIMYIPLITGIASLVLVLTGVFSIGLAIISIITGRVFENQRGHEVAERYHFRTGFICSCISLVLAAVAMLAIILWIVGIFSFSFLYI